MEESGVVTSVSGRIAHVKVQRSPMCEKCSGGVCTMSDSGMDVEAINAPGAREGQHVLIEMPSGHIKGSLIAYGIPVAALILGAILGKDMLSRYFPGKDPEMVSALTGFGALGVSLLIVKLWSVFLHKPGEAQLPVIKQIVEDNNS